MKKLIVGVAWQMMGFLGAVLLICTAVFNGPWDYNGITGLLGALLGTQLLWPLGGCILFFLLGGFLCYQVIQGDARKKGE